MLDATSSFSHESEATRVKTIMADSTSTPISSEFWHRNLVHIPSFTNAFIEKMASENLPVKVTLTSILMLLFNECMLLRRFNDKMMILYCVKEIHIVCLL